MARSFYNTWLWIEWVFNKVIVQGSRNTLAFFLFIGGACAAILSHTLSAMSAVGQVVGTTTYFAERILPGTTDAVVSGYGIANAFFPLQEGFDFAVGYLVARGIAYGYRFIKGWIPTVQT